MIQMREILRSGIIACVLAGFILFAFTMAGAKEPWVRKKSPTIEELTKGKVKIGDIINRKNVDLVKEYLPPSIYECVQRGMILRMGNQLSLEERVPRYFIEATEKYRGQAVVDKHGTTYLRDGSLWPGGIPFVEPKTALEVMANVKYGDAFDDIVVTPYTTHFINSKGKVYKTNNRMVKILNTTCRLGIPPLGAIPGMEKIKYKRVTGQTYPLAQKGLGLIVTRYYDDTKYQDEGFIYLPAFKRTIRVSVTTWQDSIGGSDMTYGDTLGFSEPYGFWDFKLIGKKLMLIPEPKSPFTLVSRKTGELHPDFKFTEGEKFPVLGWCITPLYVVEATPKVRHIYKKRMLYVLAPEYWAATQMFPYTEMYDRAGKLWKMYLTGYGSVIRDDGEPRLTCNTLNIYDFQADHMSFLFLSAYWQTGLKPKDFTLKSLLHFTR